MPKAPSSPGTTRTPRTRALEIGTAANGFPPDSSPYNPSAGVPEKDAGGTYRDDVTGMPTPGSTNDPSPFKLGGQ